MNAHNNVHLMFYEYLQDAVSPTERSLVETHLALCKECAAELETMREALSLFPVPSAQASEERPEEFWNMFASKIAEKAVHQQPEQRNSFAEFVEWIEQWLLFRPKYAYAGGGIMVLTLLMLGFWTFYVPENREITTLFKGKSNPLDHTTEPTSTETDGYAELSAPSDRVNHYFRKSKTLLVGFANMKTDQREPLDLSMERRVSRDLIREARYLRQQPIDPRSRQLMNDLEKILIELKNIEEKNDLPEVEIIRSGIHQENLLFKIRMAEAMYDSASFMHASQRR